MECGELRATIIGAARDEAKQQFGIVVTQQDLEAAKRITTMRDPAEESAAERGRTTAILGAILAVYDKGQDPNQVYDQMLQNQIPRKLWIVYVHDARTPDGRKHIEKLFKDRLTWTPDFLTKASSGTEPWRKTAENMKLDETIDQVIAASDPQFETYLKEFQNSERELQVGAKTYKYHGPNHVPYLNQKRWEFWKSQVSKLDVYLSDPSLFQTCGLSNIGVQSARQ